MTPFVSVIIPTYNRVHLVTDAIDSVLAQTYGDFELLVVDDHSTDNTKEVVKSYEDVRVKYFINERIKGAPGARNTGITKANGKYIAFLDSDDIYHQKKIELQVQHLKTKPKVDVSVGTTLKGISFEKAKKIDPSNNREITPINFLVERVKFITGAPLWRKEMLKKNEGWFEALESSQDWEFHLRAILNGFNFDYCPAARYLIREHAKDRIVSKNVINRVENKLIAIDNIKNVCKLSLLERLFMHYLTIKLKYVRGKKLWFASTEKS